jgi:cell volume regulation protein A
MLPLEHILLGAAVLLLISIVASKASGVLGVPALLLFLLIGMLAGSDGPGGIYFDDARLAQSLGVIALVFILFSGGLDTNWSDIRPVLGTGVALATLGVLLTAILVGLFAAQFLGFSLLEGLLLGAIVSSTDAAAVFAIMRSRGASLKGKLGPLIELESGSNDPMAVFLTVSFTSLLTAPNASLLSLVPVFAVQMTVGAVVGYGGGRLMTIVINRLRLEYEGLYPVLTLALVMLVYAVTAVLGGNGFLAAYLAGLVMGNRDFVHKRSLMRFHDGIAWLMQIVMFLALGLLVFPSRLVTVVGSGLLLSAFLMLVARPLSVFITMLPAPFNLRERAIVAWVGLRGAVPIILATFPLLAGLPKAEEIFNLVFFIVLTSVLVQGTSIPLVGRWLRVSAPAETAYRYPLEFIPAISSRSKIHVLEVRPESCAVGRSIMEMNFPAGALIVLINRGGTDVVPNGGTVLRAEDKLLILADEKTLATVRNIVRHRA